MLSVIQTLDGLVKSRDQDSKKQRRQLIWLIRHYGLRNLARLDLKGLSLRIGVQEIGREFNLVGAIRYDLTRSTLITNTIGRSYR